MRLRGKQKLSDNWEQDVHVVVRKVFDIVSNQRERVVLSGHCIEICCCPAGFCNRANLKKNRSRA